MKGGAADECLAVVEFHCVLGVTVYAVYLFVYLIRTRISYIRLGQKRI
ncbi:hypothetical protein PO124_05350 [Bacillus licheniformis]|nr:hypothetical protein [Bacillus licheniformis]